MVEGNKQTPTHPPTHTHTHTHTHSDMNTDLRKKNDTEKDVSNWWIMQFSKKYGKCKKPQRY